MMLEPRKITPTLYEIRVKGAHRIGRAEMQEDGFFGFFPGIGTTGEVFLSSHTLRKVADILDGLNAPIEASLKEYFDRLPPEIGATGLDDTPF